MAPSGDEPVFNYGIYIFAIDWL